MTRTWFLLPVCVAVAVAVFAGCGGGKGGADIATAKPGELTYDQMRDMPDGKRMVYERDFYAREDLASTEYETLEALEWLKADNHKGGEVSKADLQKTVEDFYDAGAKKVYVTGIAVFKPEDFGMKPADEEQAKGVHVSDTLIVEMPDEPEKRKTVIEFAAKWFLEYYEEEYSTEDFGQQYIQIQFG